MELHCVKGVGQDHAKFSPVATASYRLLPHIIFRQPIPPELCDKFVKCFPSGVLAVELDARGQKKVAVKDMRKDTVSREVLRHKEFEGMIELTRIRDFFMCESVLIVLPVVADFSCKQSESNLRGAYQHQV